MGLCCGMAVSRIVSALRKTILDDGGPRRSFYVGITHDLARRLAWHFVSPDDAETYECDSNAAARDVEAAMIDWGTDGRTGGDHEGTRFVYCYKITQQTRERDFE